MSKVKTLLLATASSVALAGGIQAVQAADLPLKAPPVYRPAFSWTGCHVGAHWGWGWGKKDGTSQSAGIATFVSFGTFNNKLSGPIFGGQLGCDYQWPSSNFVIGLEGSYSAADINGTSNHQNAGSNGFGMVKSKVDGLASFTGRIGWSGWDPMVLFYVKGGWAWAHERDFFTSDGSHSISTTTSHNGWVLGGGVEWALSFAPRWSTFVEYQHYDFNKGKFIQFSGTDPIGSVVKLKNVDTIKIGVNYKLFAGEGRY